MKEPNTSHDSLKGEKRSKATYIRQLKVNNPQMKASKIAKKANTSIGYVYNVLSKAKRDCEVERRREDRLYGTVHGHSFYRDKVWPEWYEELRAPVVNSRTGMKQVGFKKNDDLCSCQIHKNGGVVVFPHALGWREWLKEALMNCGWDVSKATLLVDNLTIQVVLAEARVKIPEGYLPKEILVKTSWGMMFVRDDSPTKNMLEVKLSVPDLERFLGLPEIRKQVELIAKGTMTTTQLLRGVIGILLKYREKIHQNDD